VKRLGTPWPDTNTYKDSEPTQVQQSSDSMIWNAAGEMQDLGRSRRLCDSPEMGLRTASGLLLAGPAATLPWDQRCWVAAELCWSRFPSVLPLAFLIWSS